MTARPAGSSRQSKTRRKASARDTQEPSIFARILLRLVEATPGAVGAALVDYEGETVDYAGVFDAYELKVTAAHWQIVLSELAEAKVSAMRQLTVRAKQRSYLVRQIHDHYTIVLVLHRHAAFSVSDRAIEQAHAELCAEAGFDPPKALQRWIEVDVETDGARRPARVRGLRSVDSAAWHAVEVIGAVVGLRPKERGFRVRLANGVEMTLVRERFGRWFADEHLDERS